MNIPLSRSLPFTTRPALPPFVSPISFRILSGSLANSVFLDKIYFKNQTSAQGSPHPAHLPLPDVLSIVIDSFTSATERHIEVRFSFASYPH